VACEAITGWGIAAMTNGHGGGNGPVFVDHMLDFMTNPRTTLRTRATSIPGSVAADHTLTGPTKFPKSAAECRRRAQALSAP
jgi:hypothetical protein